MIIYLFLLQNPVSRIKAVHLTFPQPVTGGSIGSFPEIFRIFPGRDWDVFFVRQLSDKTNIRMTARKYPHHFPIT
jgi:hypothetical protein